MCEYFEKRLEARLGYQAYLASYSVSIEQELV